MPTVQPSLFAEAPRAMSLTQLTLAIGQAIRVSPTLQNAWVVAELSDVRVNGGHCYMELIEKNAAGQTVAKIRATIWQSRFNYIRQKFFSATGRDIATGMKVMLNGAASHHQLYGLSFNINDIDPSYTLGDMERLRREILERLQREGVIDNNKRTYLTPTPQRVAVISAEGAAGYGDFMNQIVGNPDGFVFYPFLFPAIMQGDRTSESVRRALEAVEMTVDLWDCVVIIRGGGATTDLNGFDEYELARAVATFPLPVIVGIGHERDRTVLDEIAHTRCKTPTAVAAYLVDSLRATWTRTTAICDWIARYSTDRLTGESRRLANCEAMIPTLVDSRINTARSTLDRAAALLQAHAASRTQRAAMTLDNTAQVIARAADYQLKRSSARLDSLAGLVDAFAPDKTLKRGYSVTRVDGKAVTDASQLKPGTMITTQLHTGQVVSTIND